MSGASLSYPIAAVFLSKFACAQNARRQAKSKDPYLADAAADGFSGLAGVLHFVQDDKIESPLKS